MSTERDLKPSTPEQRASALDQAGITADRIVDTIETELGIATDTDLAEFLGVSKATISSWRRRNSIPFEVIVYLALKGSIDITYVLFQRGRLSGFTSPSESLEDADLQRELIATALARAAPVALEESDIDRAAEEIQRRKQFYADFLVKEHGGYQKMFLSSYIPFALDLLRDLKRSAISQRKEGSGKEGPQ